jgi:hypothetical protein
MSNQTHVGSDLTLSRSHSLFQEAQILTTANSHTAAYIDGAAVEQLFRTYPSEIGAIIIEPVAASTSSHPSRVRISALCTSWCKDGLKRRVIDVCRYLHPWPSLACREIGD